ncbi:hypothetical protein [Domibacillus enclensis]|uniref:Uncharacterized protein n=1 Tax=Domibacillus enclensis TaxID=1017273 RepID=A0A1N6WHG8_9BACI|nr:hypothetical protein [Domibacillus enclensis]SIQ89553.1 hypothetical protein SAMN05443094_104169 [Domibacillus enclensis]
MNLAIILISAFASAALMLTVCSFDAHFRIKKAYEAGRLKGREDALNSFHDYRRREWKV